MNRKILVVALALMATTLLTTNVFAQAACSSGVTIQFNGVGSSAQANSFALAAKTITAYGTSPFYNLVSTKKGAVITDKRPASGPVTDSANPFWVIWDNNAVCNVYVYWTIDSGAGVKDFFSYEKFTNGSGKVYTSLAAVYGTLTDSSFAGNENQVGGLADTQDSQVGVAGSAFEAIEAVLNTTPETRVASGNVQALRGRDGRGLVKRASQRSVRWMHHQSPCEGAPPRAAVGFPPRSRRYRVPKPSRHS